MAKKKSVNTQLRQAAKKATASKVYEHELGNPTRDVIDVRVRILESREAMFEKAVISPAVTAGDLSVGSFFVQPKNTGAS